MPALPGPGCPWPRVLPVQGHQGVAQGDGLRAGRDLQLVGEHPLQGGEAAQPAGAVAPPQGGSQHPQVRGLVHRIEPQQRLPPLGRHQQLGHQRLVAFPRLLDPVLHDLGKEDGGPVAEQPCAGLDVGRPLVQGPAGGHLELDGVDPEGVPRGQADHVLAQLEDPGAGPSALRA